MLCQKPPKTTVFAPYTSQLKLLRGGGTLAAPFAAICTHVATCPFDMVELPTQLHTASA